MALEDCRWAALEMACTWFEITAPHMPDSFADANVAMIAFERYLGAGGPSELEVRRRVLGFAIRTARGNPAAVVTQADKFLRFLKTGKGPLGMREIAYSDASLEARLAG